MPPRIPLAHLTRCCRSSIERTTTPTRSAAPLASLLAGLSLHQQPPISSLSSQVRRASILSNLRDNKGAYNKRIRKGRGASSGYGKTSGRGTKGQGQHGKVKPWFQGGQTPLIFKHGRMGFTNHGKEDLAEVNLTRLQAWIDAGRIDPTKPITPRELIKCRLIGSVPDGVKLLAHGRYEAKPQLKQPLEITVSRASASAIRAIEAAGGKIVTRYYTKQAIKNLLRGQSVHTDTPLPRGRQFVEAELEKARAEGFKKRLPDPVGRWHIEYYRDPAHRGYLSHQVAPGESPSLFFKVPEEVTKKREVKASKKSVRGDRELFELR
ncbi:unnamed protein product [Discula destructiva]